MAQNATVASSPESTQPTMCYVCAGQAVVQIVEERGSRTDYAIKFFLSSQGFINEKDLYLDSSKPLGKFLPKLRAIVDGKNGTMITDTFGRSLPPCIVMEKGEALDAWIEKSGSLDMFTGLQVCMKLMLFACANDCGTV
jgi:hypothetical protein